VDRRGWGEARQFDGGGTTSWCWGERTRKRDPKKAAELLAGMDLVTATMEIADAIEALHD
jgi:hypothetical protein